MVAAANLSTTPVHYDGFHAAAWSHYTYEKHLMTTPKRLRAIKDRRSTWARRHKALAGALDRYIAAT